MRQPLQKAEIISFRDSLLRWYATAKRDLPWRRTRDPYAIWLSETMLQQTRVSAVLPFYSKFLERFPTVHHLADAPEAELLAAWAGLGYYNRARNLQKAALTIKESGSFPRKYSSLRALPGVGDYTAAAVASIAFDEPHAVVDGNVLRVLSRIYADPADIASQPGRHHFVQLANLLLDETDPAAYNQAVMELGATICLPKNPQCLLCPVAAQCRALHAGRPTDFPVKSKKLKSTDHVRHLLWIEREGAVLAWQRPPESRLMPGFWELPEPEHLAAAKPTTLLGVFKHSITTYNYTFQLHKADAPRTLAPCEWLYLHSLATRPISTVFRKAVQLVKAHNKARAAQVNY